eukprot:3352243-Pyramimonas_sp.AAC.1
MPRRSAPSPGRGTCQTQRPPSYQVRPPVQLIAHPVRRDTRSATWPPALQRSAHCHARRHFRTRSTLPPP